ncbi:MAG TPA: dihydroorotate dehydrogenase-like protein [Acetobacteraceae bacterium]|jgi:dihydroorotate dehydrogenase (fumarate)|nr:dihydroorotate dehydrogenase-like protein [Acetobacteraceae bacterium]
MDLSTNYLGLTLRNPLIASASPLSGNIGAIREMEDSGAGAIVLPSLFEEQIREEERLIELLTDVGTDSNPEASSYFPTVMRYNAGPQGYLDLIARARRAVAVPIIASLNGTTEASWLDYAQLIEQAGASGLELNIYRIATDPAATGGSVESDTVALLRAVRERIRIPIAVKLHPYFSAFGALAHQLDEAGADALVLFNRLYQPDIDIDRLRWTDDLALSDAGEIRLVLLWLSRLAGHLRHASLAAGTGVETVAEVIKYLLCGADAVMTASALLRHGPAYLRTLTASLEQWMDARGFTSLGTIRSLMRPSHPEAQAEADTRSHYIRTLSGYRGPYLRH